MFTYLVVNCLVTLLSLSIVLLGASRADGRRVVMTIVCLLILTAVFDAIMISLGLFRYNPARISGVHIGIVPIEDFFYPIVAAIIVPLLWEGKKND